MPEINQISGRISIFNPATHFAIGEIVLFVEHCFIFKIDVAKQEIVCTLFVPKNTTAIIRDFMLIKDQEPKYHVIPTQYYCSFVFAELCLPRELCTALTTGDAKHEYVDLEDTAQEWYTQAMIVFDPEADHNMLARINEQAA